MANLYVSSEKRYNQQFAVSYAVYMMAGSYFYKARAKNQLEITHMYLHYAEMPVQKQIDAEKRVMALMEKQGKKFCEAIDKLSCEVHTRRTDTGIELMFLTGGFEEFVISIDKDGHLSIMVLNCDAD